MDYKDKIFKHRLTNVYRVGLVIALVIVVIIGIKVNIDNQIYTRFETLQTLDRVGSASSKFLQYENNLLVYSQDGASAYTTNGKQIWNQTFEMQNIMIKTAGEYVVAADYKKSMIYAMNGKGPTATFDTNLPILDINVSKSGLISAALEDDNTIYIRLYDQDASLVSEIKTSMRQSGYPISFAVSPDNVKTGVSYLKAENGKINTSLAFYNFGGVGQNETDNLVSGYDFEDEIIPLVIYPNDNTAIAISDKKLNICKGKQKPTVDKTEDIDFNVQAVFYNDNYFALVKSSVTEGKKYDILVYDMNGKKQLTHSIDFEYSNIILQDKRLVIYNQSRLQILSLGDVIKFDGEMGANLQALIPVDGYARFLAVYNDRMELVKLR